MNIHRLLELVKDHWQCDEVNTARYDGLTQEQKRQAELDHVLRHFAMELGRIATLRDPEAHGDPRPEQYENQTLLSLRNLLICVMRVAALEGIPSSRLVLSIGEWVQHHARAKRGNGDTQSTVDP